MYEPRSGADGVAVETEKRRFVDQTHAYGYKSVIACGA
jgi:hypothetical protein